jgi:spore germination protein GerM
VVAAGATFLLAACGVATDDEPRDLAAERVPFDLLAPQTTTTTTTTTPIVTVPVLVYLLANDRLVLASRELPAPVTVADVMRSLLEGPTDEEAALGRRTAITTEVRLRSVTVESGVATIDLSEEFAAIGNPQQIEAIAQLVFTATSVAGVGAVRFAIEGEPRDVPAGDGTLTPAPVGQADYSAFAPG